MPPSPSIYLFARIGDGGGRAWFLEILQDDALEDEAWGSGAVRPDMASLDRAIRGPE